MGLQECQACGGTAIDYDPSQGATICMQCGIVLQENNIVMDEVTFGEASTGAAIVTGSFVGADQVRTQIKAPFHAGQSSRETVLRTGRRKIQLLGSALKLPDYLVERGTRFYTLAVDQGFCKGRKTLYVAGACLYIGCRLEKTAHMLIDFSEKLQVNVFSLGATYLKLVQALALDNIPLIDPSIYITRFAMLLEFGSETAKVSADATRLVKRFDRDWMQTGRRPAGICAACIILAARMNNFRRSILEVVQVAKIGDSTIRKRLDEFSKSKSGKLSVEEFRSVWLEDAEDPPALQQAKKRERGLKWNGEDGENDHDDQEEQRVKKARRLDENIENHTFGIPFPENDNIQNPKEQDQAEMVVEQALVEDVAGLLDSDLGKTLQEEAEKERTLRTVHSDPVKAVNTDKVVDNVKAIDTSKTDPPAEDPDSEMNYKSPQFALHPGEHKGMLYYDDLDDDELDAFILDEEEVESKTRVWMEFNRDYLEKLAEKHMYGSSEATKPRKPRKPRVKKDGGEGASNTTSAPEAAAEMLRKKFSRKINYSVIEGMLDSNNVIAAIERQRKMVPSIEEQEVEMETFDAGTLGQAPQDETTDGGGWEEGAEDEGFDDYEV